MTRRLLAFVPGLVLALLTFAAPARAQDLPSVVKAMSKDAGALAAVCRGDKHKLQACQAFCPNGVGRLCALQDELVATAAAAVDANGILALFGQANDALKNEAKSRNLERELFAPTSASFSRSFGPAVATDFVAVALQGLAKFVLDRAKLESAGWFLQQLGDSLCNDPEVVGYWLPKTCALAAAQGGLSQYGAGAELLDGLRQALLADGRGWPGVAGGLALGNVFVEDSGLSYLCSGADKGSRQCTALEGIRRATAERISGLLEGRNALVELSQLSASLHGYNVKDPSTGSLYSAATQITACGLGAPLAFKDLRGVVETSTGSDSLKAEASLLAALVFVPACQALTLCQEGLDCRKTYPALLPGSESAFSQVEALGALARPVHAAHDVGAHFRILEASIKELLSAIEAAKRGQDIPSLIRPPALSIAGGETPEAAAAAVSTYLQETTRAVVQSAYGRVVTAAVGVAESALALGSTAVSLVRHSSGVPTLLPGLCARWPNTCSTPSTWLGVLDRADHDMARLRAQLSSLKQILGGNWGVAFPVLVEELTRSRSAHTSRAHHVLAKRAAVLVALLQAKDGDAAARVIASAADPPGGWRAKQRPGAFTFSIDAQPGIWSAAEVRRGTYGVVRERGKPVYFQAPTLALPVGLDFAWGYCSCRASYGLFVPLIDPAAFLQYDASKSARLPGASLKTVLSPGIAFRFNLPTTPFSLSPMFVYRPGFRAWKSEVNAVGADAFQLGLLASVDVTLFSVTKEHE